MNPIKVLIVDDHEMVRSGLRRWLDAEEDISVVGDVNRGGLVLDQMRRLVPDVVLLDLHLPDIPGLEVIRSVRGAGDTTPIMVMTGYERNRAQAALDAGANGFIRKDERRVLVIDAIRWAASREPGTWVSPSAVDDLRATNAAIADARLTPAELRMLALIEKPIADIAAELGITEGTVRNRISTIYVKIGVTTRIEAAAWARKHGLAGG